MELTPKQEQFAQLVATGKTYADAYRVAYSVKNMSVNSIYVKSSELINNGKITVRVSEIQEANLERNQVTLDEVLKEMARWLRFNLKSIIKEDGCIKSFEEMTDDEAACIASFENVELFDGVGKKRTMTGYLKKVKLIDKRAVSDQFMKKFGAYAATRIKLDDEDLEHIQDLVNSIKK